MRMLVPVLFVVACSAPTAPEVPLPTTAARPLDQPSGPGTRHLLASDAELILPRSSLRTTESFEERWVLGPVAADPASTGSTGRSTWRFELPFPSDNLDSRFRPEGMSVHHSGGELPYDMTPMAPGHVGWRPKGNQLFVALNEPAHDLSVELHYPAIKQALTRMNFEASGLSASDFADYSVTRDDVTRPGLLLPAPASASWQVTVPANGRFAADPMLIDHPFMTGTSDGARVSLSITTQGESHTVSTRGVGEPPSFWSQFRDAQDPRWRVDLSEYAGQAVTLTLNTHSGGDTAHDYLFIGSPTVSGSPDTPPRHIVVLAVDTLRPDHLGSYGYARATSPDLDALADASVVFERAWAPAPRTRPSFRSSFTGRGALDAVGAPNTAQTFRDAGFATAGIVANMHLTPRFDFNRGFDLWELHNSVDAVHQVDRALEWMREHQHEDTFLFLHLMDPHLFYKPPAPFDTLFVDDPDPTLPVEFNRWTATGWQRTGELDERRMEHIIGLYDGEIAAMSAQVGRFVEQLEQIAPNTAIVFHTDHGEELWDHGGFEHNHALWEEVVRAALWVRPAPSQHIAPHRNTEPVALWDIGPTLTELAGLQGPPVDGRSLLGLMTGDDPGGWNRALPLGQLMYDVEQWGVVFDGHKYVLHTASGDEHLYNLDVDPGETVDLATSTELTPFRQALATAHGMPVGPGWRIELELRGDEPLVWHLPAPAQHAFVIDPEASRTSRANLAWGERAPLTVDDIAQVQLSEDSTVLTITPGNSASGLIGVIFDNEVPPSGTLVRAGTTLTTYSSRTGLRGRGPKSVITTAVGTVVQPPVGESARMRALTSTDDASLALLEALGYVGGGE